MEYFRTNVPSQKIIAPTIGNELSLEYTRSAVTIDNLEVSKN